MSNESPRKPAIVVAARALVVHRDHVLLLQAIEPGREYYFLPGGGVRHGETLAAACQREVREETGLEVRVLRPLCLREFIAARHRRRPQGMPPQQHAVAVIFLCEVAGADAGKSPDQLGVFVRDGGADTVQGLCWKPLKQAAQLEIHPPQIGQLLARGLDAPGFEFWPEDDGP